MKFKHYFMYVRTLVAVVILTCSAKPVLSDNAPGLNNEGIDAYHSGDIDQSIQKFTEALVERPDSPELRFNRGTALSAAGQAEEAVTELSRSAESFDDSLMSAAAHFNAGNTLIGSGNSDTAIENYRQAIMLDQASPDFRKNLELVLRQQQQQQQQQQEQQNDEQQQSDEQQDQQDEQDQQDQEESSEDQQSDEQQEQSEEQQNEQEQQQQAQPENQQELTPEQARQLLDAMQNEENNALELKRQMMQEAMQPGDDW